jgi:hypothetical protein
MCGGVALWREACPEDLEMDIREFAEKYRVKVKRDHCGDEIVPGKPFCTDLPDGPENRCHIYDVSGAGQLGICLLYSHAKRWNAAQRAMLGAGFIPQQIGDTEGCYSFDLESDAQAKLALKLARIKRRRIPSAAQLAAAAKGLSRIGQPPSESLVPMPNSDAP